MQSFTQLIKQYRLEQGRQDKKSDNPDKYERNEKAQAIFPCFRGMQYRLKFHLIDHDHPPLFSYWNSEFIMNTRFK